ncbi:MAG: hypothetical protein Q8O31_06765 [Rhodocyclaceae bacterium]|nr:hypothetical protein [Rhodocyclaceae bacterium]
MTMALTFDTFKFIEKLENAGVSRAQAKAEAEVLTEIFSTNAAELATKGDIRELKGDIRALEDRVNGKFATLEERINGKFSLQQWMIGFSLALNIGVFLKIMGP